MAIEIEITETGRHCLKEEAYILGKITEIFHDTEGLKEYLIDRYGKIPNGRKKIYHDKQSGETTEVGFLHSYWQDDYDSDSKWYKTDWVTISKVTYEPMLLKEVTRMTVSPEHHKRLDKLIEDARTTMHKMMDAAMRSSAMSYEMQNRDSYVFAKAIITIWGDQRNYAPHNDKKLEQDIENLAHCI